MPTEISMQNDIKQWKNNEIIQDEKLLVKRCLDFLLYLWLVITCFRLSDLLRMLNVIHFMPLLKKAYNLMVVYICDSLTYWWGFYSLWNNHIKAKDDFQCSSITTLAVKILIHILKKVSKRYLEIFNLLDCMWRNFFL